MKRLIIISSIIAIVCSFVLFNSPEDVNTGEYSQIVLSSPDYDAYWHFLGKKIYPVPVNLSNNPLDLLNPEIFKKLTPAEKKAVVSEIDAKIIGLRAISSSIRSTFSSKIGGFNFCFILTRDDLNSDVGSKFSIYHELVHCEVRAAEGGAGLRFYLDNERDFYTNMMAAISVHNETAASPLAFDKVVISYAKNMDESYADIVSLAYLYESGEKKDIFYEAIYLRDREFCRTSDFTHWSSPLLAMAIGAIESGDLASKFNGDYRKMAMDIIQTTQKKDAIFNYINNNEFMGRSMHSVCSK